MSLAYRIVAGAIFVLTFICYIKDVPTDNSRFIIAWLLMLCAEINDIKDILQHRN